MATTSTPVQTPRRSPGRLYLWLGLALGLLGPVCYAVQLQAQRLTAPWYVPILGSVAVAAVLFAILRTRSVWRFLALALLVVFAAGEWFFLLSMSKLPDYKGPVRVNEPFPAFSTTLSDGSPFDESKLKGPQATVLVFFRGRW
jgi:FtsH-binding integral membrane protein